MANPYFQFKQFTVYHDKCAMKVGTDGVLLGAWAKMSNAARVLDIGTGTGLVALMITQRYPHVATKAIDIDADAIIQASENIKQSPFSSSISCEYISLQSLSLQDSEKFDHIVSNPPYFAHSLKSPDNQRTLARHTDSLYLNELIEYSQKLLTHGGKVSIIYPYQNKEDIIRIATKNKLHPSRVTNVYPTPSSEAKRVLIELSTIESTCIENNLVIEESRHVYTEDFTALVKDFYLKM